MDDLKIVFMGTPEFAVASLKALVESGQDIVGVITAPDKPKGRGKQLGISAVKEYALTENLNILQPTNLKDSTFLKELRSLEADVQIVVAFRMLPEVVWNMPSLGSFNLHASLLPDYRGAAPINWAIINGESKTGVTTFKLKHEIDTGSILYQEDELIHEEDTVGTLYERLMNKGAKLIVKTVETLKSGDYDLKPQLYKAGKHAPKIFKGDCKVDWSKSSNDIRNFVRGLSPYPTAWTPFTGKTLKLFRIEKADISLTLEKGHFSIINKHLFAKTGDGVVEILDCQLEGKKRMQTAELLRGLKIENENNFE